MFEKVAKKYSQLRGRITSSGLTHADIARKIGISPTSFSNKMGGKADFTQPEIRDICTVLEIEPSEIGAYFFGN